MVSPSPPLKGVRVVELGGLAPGASVPFPHLLKEFNRFDLSRSFCLAHTSRLRSFSSSHWPTTSQRAYVWSASIDSWSAYASQIVDCLRSQIDRCYRTSQRPSEPCWRAHWPFQTWCDWGSWSCSNGDSGIQSKTYHRQTFRIQKRRGICDYGRTWYQLSGSIRCSESVRTEKWTTTSSCKYSCRLCRRRFDVCVWNLNGASAKNSVWPRASRGE